MDPIVERCIGKMGQADIGSSISQDPGRRRSIPIAYRESRHTDDPVVAIVDLQRLLVTAGGDMEEIERRPAANTAAAIAEPQHRRHRAIAAGAAMIRSATPVTADIAAFDKFQIASRSGQILAVPEKFKIASRPLGTPAILSSASLFPVGHRITDPAPSSPGGGNPYR